MQNDAPIEWHRTHREKERGRYRACSVLTFISARIPGAQHSQIPIPHGPKRSTTFKGTARRSTADLEMACWSTTSLQIPSKISICEEDFDVNISGSGTHQFDPQMKSTSAPSLKG
eukprot:2083755-Rhodomonas_salina.1